MQSAHIDRFVLDRLPPAELMPAFSFDLPELDYPAQMNAAVELLDRAIADGRGERIAFYCAQGLWRYAELAATTNRIAHVLVDDLGLKPGNRVLLRGVNSPMLAAIWLAVLKAGGIVVTSMPMLRARELSAMIEKAAISLAFCETELTEELSAAVALAPAWSKTVTYSADGADDDLSRLLRGKPATFSGARTLASDPALIAFTSGTTGGPKATIHLHRDILAIADCFPRSILAARESDIFLCSAPMAFTFGLGAHLVFPLRHGAAAVLVPTPNPDRFLDVLIQYRPTIVMTAPTAYRAMTPRARSIDLGHVRHFVSAGEHLPVATFDAWRAATGHRIVNGIGATEMLHIFISAAGTDIRPGSIGRAIPGYQAAVFDDSMRVAPSGEIGRLGVRGPTGCRYLDDARQATYVTQGWNLTGDSCFQDEDGYIWFQSRTDEMIVSSGYNISGREVEEAILLHAAVQECAVVGTADEERGTIVKAFIVLRPEFGGRADFAAEIQSFVKSTIAPYKYPRAIEFVKTLPRSDAGKVQRYVLRNQGQYRDVTPDQGEIVLTNITAVNPDAWPRPSGYSNGIVTATGLLFIAGQIGWDAQGRFPDDFIGQVRQTLENIVAVLAASGGRPDQITRLTWYVTDRQEYKSRVGDIGAIYRDIIGRHFPAMSVVEVSGLIEDAARVEIEATAFLG